uniref:Radical SAM/Cys-rich domain-containing protein n=1 Tax=Candidatus Kentrum sp. DK TaxID=2126562 RepID=A0A450SE49_9GAMM|nr:MAG: radical SAM/Cys-rich domain-containing protein [Candidatus Kentron sp. DK]
MILPPKPPDRFPPLTRTGLDTLQVNLGYRCNQSCKHCHVGAGPHRIEEMEAETIEEILAFLREGKATHLDLTGGAPELNPHFRYLVQQARDLGIHVIDRCNLTVLEEPDRTDLAGFLADHGVEIVASLPCYLEENVDGQRGNGVFARSLCALRRLNALGYGQPGAGLLLNLVYNPTGPFLPPPQQPLEAGYKRELAARYGVVFDRLYALTNLPLARFADRLRALGKLEEYKQLLRNAFRQENLEQVMCRSLVSVDWRGWVYDCDFNQMLDLPMEMPGRDRIHVRELAGRVDPVLTGNRIVVGEHCFGCAAGQGSSCGGALDPFASATSSPRCGT